MTDLLESEIAALREDQLVRVAQFLYEDSGIDLHDLESDPPTLGEVIAEVSSLAAIDASPLLGLPPDDLARRVLILAAQGPDRDTVATAVASAQQPIMSGPQDVAVLVVVAAFALRAVVHFEIDNSGRSGRRKWRLRLGGSDGGATNALRAWLVSLGESEARPPSREK